MSTLMSAGLKRRASVVVAAGLLAAAVPAVSAGAAGAAALPQAKITLTDGNNNVGVSGSTKIYNPAKPIAFAWTVAPNKTGKSTTLTVQRLVNGTFFDLGSTQVSLNSASKAEQSIVANALHSGGTYRAQITMAADSANAASASNYVNWKMTGTETDIKPATISLHPTDKPAKPGVFPAGKPVEYTVRVTPNKGGETVNFYVDKFVAGKWVSFSKASKTLGAQGYQTYLVIAGKRGEMYRIRADWLGDAYNSRVSSAYYPVNFK